MRTQRTPVCREHSIRSTSSFVPGHGHLPACPCRSLRRLHTPNQGRAALPVPVGHQLLTQHRHRRRYGSPGTLYKSKVLWHAFTGRREMPQQHLDHTASVAGQILHQRRPCPSQLTMLNANSCLMQRMLQKIVYKCTLTGTNRLKLGQLACWHNTQC